MAGRKAGSALAFIIVACMRTCTCSSANEYALGNGRTFKLQSTSWPQVGYIIAICIHSVCCFVVKSCLTNLAYLVRCTRFLLGVALHTSLHVHDDGIWQA